MCCYIANHSTLNHEVTLHNAAAYLTQHALPDLCAEDKHLTRDKPVRAHTHGNKAYTVNSLLFAIVT